MLDDKVNSTEGENSIEKSEDVSAENVTIQKIENVSESPTDEIIKPSMSAHVDENSEALVTDSVLNEDVKASIENSDQVSEPIEDNHANEVPKSRKEEEKPEINLEKLDLEGLVKELQKLLKTGKITDIKSDVDLIKKSFNKQFGELLADKKAAFIEVGGNEIDFYYSTPIKSAYNDLLFEYKTKREAHYENKANEQKENLNKRLALIEALKELIENAEPSTMYSKFKDLQATWSSIGNIPSAQYNDTWRTYDHHVDRFYDLLHLSNDLRDLDFKHNLEEKLKLAARAEVLAEMTDLNAAFKELQVLHRMWKEEIGPVGREHREEIWERFSKATKKIHDKRHEHQKVLESKYEENVDKKRAVIEKISNLIDDSTNTSYRYWQDKIKELEALRQQFFKLGKVPRNLNDKIWNEFKGATCKFNRLKNAYYKNVKSEQHANLEKKNALLAKAEALKDSEDFDATTNIMRQIQAEWKTIGHVPRKYSDKIWKQFKDACNHYFDRLHGKQDEANKEQIASFEEKKKMLESIKSQADKTEAMTLEAINTFVEDWSKLENLPHNMHHIEIKFNKTINVLYGKLDLDPKEIAMLKFKNMVNGYLETKNYRKLDSEQLFVRKKVDEFTKEIQQLENNMGFFANADSDSPLLKGVRDNIENNNNQLEIWKTKLEYITGLDY